jgi:3-oxoacyl-[acyl-carrier protein] reductase
MLALRKFTPGTEAAGGSVAEQAEREGAGDRRLAGKIALVTGGSSGIGRAIAIACARAGADVAINFRQNDEGARETADRIRPLGARVEIRQFDVAAPGAADDLASDLGRTYGRVDIWINNAGADILTRGARGLSPVEKLDLLLRVDVRGTVLASWAAADLMGRQPSGGVIINVSWDHVTQGMAGENPILYSVAKGAIQSFSRSLAREVAPGVRVNVLAPGFIATAFEDEAPESWRRRVIEATPLRRWGAPEDVAGAAVYLASDEAAFLTGQVIMVNGGVVM